MNFFLYITTKGRQKWQKKEKVRVDLVVRYTNDKKRHMLSYMHL